MRSSISRALARTAALFLASGTIVFTAPAQAQLMPSFSGAPNIGNSNRQPAYGRAAPPPPAGLPGAQSSTGPAPETVLPSMMDPTQALFDAINRGDIAAARDAISRGADVNGQNELGMTPIQLSLDLGHNDITFLLLSSGAGRPNGGSSGAPVQQAAAKPAPMKQANLIRHKPSAHRTHVVAYASPAEQELPQLYAGNGGTPIPQAGFLGFNPSR
ncbi:MAG: ankyrin repeat domain-containing protein [Acetobacteraceae bacterium]|nr:ankyrin repeat domain-containing protein [Acetobacteraceae bacterium]